MDTTDGRDLDEPVIRVYRSSVLNIGLPVVTLSANEVTALYRLFEGASLIRCTRGGKALRAKILDGLIAEAEAAIRG